MTKAQPLGSGKTMRSILIIQATLALLVATASHVYLSEVAMLSALYGGAVAMINTLLLSRRVAQVERHSKTDSQSNLIPIYIGVLERFIFVLAALAIGLGLLKWLPLPLIGTFALAQLAYMLRSNRQSG